MRVSSAQLMATALVILEGTMSGKKYCWTCIEKGIAQGMSDAEARIHQDANPRHQIETADQAEAS